MTTSDPQLPSSENTVSRHLYYIVLGAVLALLACAAIRRIWPADFWWQLKTGEYIAAHGIPTVDVFSYTVAGARWIELRWLYCLFLHAIHSSIGFGGLSLASAIIIALTWALAAAPALRQPTLAAFIVLPVAILAAAQRYFLRPELFSYFFFAAFLFVLHRQEKSSRPWLYAIPLLQIAWVNLHTVFALGPAIAGLWLVVLLVRTLLSRRQNAPADVQRHLMHALRRAAIVLALTLLACLVNPYGWRSFEHAAQVLRMTHGSSFKEQIVELKGAFDYDAAAIPIFYFRALIVLFVLSLLGNIRKLDAFWTLLVISQLYLSIQSVRNIPFFCLAAAPVAIQNFRRSALLHRPAAAHLVRWLQIPIAVAAIVFCLYFVREFATNRFYVRHLDTNQFGLGLAQHRAPIEAERRLREQHWPDPIFSTMVESSYLLYCDHPVFYDGRLEVYGEDRFDEYRRIVETESGWKQAAKSYGFRTAVVGLNSRLINTLAADPNWRLAYIDDVAGVFIRADTPGSPASALTSSDLIALTDPVRRSLGPPIEWNAAGFLTSIASSVPYQQLGAFALALGFPGIAEPILADALRAYPADAIARKYHGQCLEAAGDLRGAIADYELALTVLSTDPDLLLRLANQYMTAAQPARARPLVAKALAAAPQNPRAWALQAALLAADSHWPEAVRHMQKAVELEPGNAEFRAYLEIMRKNSAAR